MATKPVKLQSAPGIKRDGTRFEGDNYIDGQWTRFQRGLPRKIGGYESTNDAVFGLARGLSDFSTDFVSWVHVGTSGKLGRHFVSLQGQASDVTDRTPVGLAANTNLLWQFTNYYDPVSASTQLVAHAANNLSIDNSSTGPIYIGKVDFATAPLTNSGMPEVSGGVVALGVYLFSYGSNGMISWTNPNTLGNPTTQAFITPQKIIKGLPLRGAGRGPAGLFWSINALIRATWEGGDTIWAFDTISSTISVLSTQGIIEYNGTYYWPGVDRFLMFNGVVREIPNPYNQNWFYDNLNFEQRQKVFAVAVARFGEIWWCYPRGSATECTHAVIYNVREGYWYDTQLPDEGRSGGFYSEMLGAPFMVGNFDVQTEKYHIWAHEQGANRVVITGNPLATVTTAIPAHYETAEISMLTLEESSDKSIRVGRIEPDFIQTGDMELTVKGRANAKADVVSDAPQIFKDSPSTSTDETIKLRSVKRLMSFKFSSNTLHGNFEAGDTMAHIEPADGRIES